MPTMSSGLSRRDALVRTLAAYLKLFRFISGPNAQVADMSLALEAQKLAA